MEEDSGKMLEFVFFLSILEFSIDVIIFLRDVLVILI